ncbi:hypothetical protein GCM10017771_97390 [Streptomyces capitiformicae]|uniref:Uncharacterized protein n=1 Tax=Streptomyces capitiformicae TaxID=2014920 RepID=A0A918ZW18_9ACTN|nr:hypothetical protein [Streptomyces capitiformicae]GHE73749.1 hypothetical protein GCM10017771_97390 [Streptomyces capitiformicae]
MPGGLGSDARQREQAGRGAGDQGAQLGVRVCDLLAQVLVALGQALEREFDGGDRGGQIGAGTAGRQAPYQLGGGQ